MSAALERGIADARRGSTARGPFLRLLRRLHLTRGDGTPRAWALAAITWGPLGAAALLRMAVGQRSPAILFDLSVHARLLVAIPLMIQAERVFGQRYRGAIDQLYRGGFAERAAVDRIVERSERLRDSPLAEPAIFAVAMLGGQAVLWGLAGPTGLFAGVSEAGSISFARLWYVTVALPIVQFLLVRWLWHWVAWAYLLMRLSRLNLATIATHPDHAAGLDFLSTPTTAFAGLVTAFAAMMAAAWGTQILDGRASVQAFAPSFVVFIVAAAAVGCGPLLPFIGMLHRARHREIERYNGLALDYVRAFHRKWIESRTDEPLLGTPDLQSLADLGNAYNQLVSIRIVPFGPRTIAVIWVAAVIPMLPLIATAMPLNELLKHIGSALLGGLPM